MTRDPAFWWRPGLSLPALALTPVAAIYGAVVARRMRRPPAAPAGLPVICIGNYTTGGEGKTPAALAVAAMLAALGRRPGFLTRGHGGRLRGPVVVTPDHAAADVGDEPLLLAALAPTVVSRDRPAGAALLAQIGVDVIVMDDGFQNPSLAKDLAIIVSDAGRGIGNGRVFPAGPLRAPLAAQVVRTDALVVVGAGNADLPIRHLVGQAGRPVFAAHLVARPTAGTGPVLAYAGIGRPGKFFRSVAETGAEVAAEVAFPDHHAFDDRDARRLLEQAERAGLRLITTAKDAVRLRGATGRLARLRDRTEVLAVELVFEHPAKMARLLEVALARR